MRTLTAIASLVSLVTMVIGDNVSVLCAPSNMSEFNDSFLNVSKNCALNEGKVPEFWPIEYRVVGTVCQGIIFVVGVLGNIMVVFVVSHSRSMHTPTNCYLMSLSIADLMVLVAAVPNEIISYYLVEDQYIWGAGGCMMFVFLQYLGINASSLSITAFTIERYIAICLPMKAQTICTVERAKKIICVLWICACCYCAPWLFLTKITSLHYRGYDPMEKCDFALSRNSYRIIFFTDIILFYVIPLILSCVLYGLMARVLFTSSIGSSKSNGCAQESKKNNANQSSRVQVVKMLFVVVAVFATLWLPYRVLVVYNSFAKDRYMELWYLMFSKTLIFINSAINPILYNAMSVKFRRAFRRAMCNSFGSRIPPESRSYSTVMTTGA